MIVCSLFGSYSLHFHYCIKRCVEKVINYLYTLQNNFIILNIDWHDYSDNDDSDDDNPDDKNDNTDNEIKNNDFHDNHNHNNIDNIYDNNNVDKKIGIYNVLNYQRDSSFRFVHGTLYWKAR